MKGQQNRASRLWQRPSKASKHLPTFSGSPPTGGSWHPASRNAAHGSGLTFIDEKRMALEEAAVAMADQVPDMCAASQVAISELRRTERGEAGMAMASVVAAARELRTFEKEEEARKEASHQEEENDEENEDDEDDEAMVSSLS